MNKKNVTFQQLNIYFRKLAVSVKMDDTRGCIRCCVGRNPYNGFIYLAGMLFNEIFLMQYYDPLRKFMYLKVRY